MFDIGWTEILLIAAVAILVVGPKELPRVLVNVGRWVAKGRAFAREFQDGVQTVMRETELEDLRVDLPDPAKILGENPITQGKSLVGGPETVPEQEFIDEKIVAEMERADEHTAEMLRHAGTQQADAEEGGPATADDEETPPPKPAPKPASGA